MREDQNNFDVILPLALGLESDSDSDSSDDDLEAHTAVVEYMSTLHSYWMRLHAMLAAGELNFREPAELSLKCMQSMHHVQSMQLIHFLSEDTVDQTPSQILGESHNFFFLADHFFFYPL